MCPTVEMCVCPSNILGVIDQGRMRIFVRFRVAEGFSCPVDRRDPKGKDATALLANIPRQRRREAVGYKGCEAFKRRSGGVD